MSHISVCGIQCSECRFFGEQCNGCAAVVGKPFWAADFPGGVCPFFSCCSNKKVAHCGQCAEFPCKTYEMRDPGMTEAEHLEGMKKRIENIKKLPK